MKIKLFLIFGLFLLLITISYAQPTVIEGSTSEGSNIFTGSPYDSDGDGVCDNPRSFYAADREKYDISRLGCTATTYGDLCPGTSSIESASRFGDNSGCGTSQTAGFVNYWSMRYGKPRPLTVNPNWLTDQRQGIRVFQPIILSRNPEYISDDEIIELKGTTIHCDNGRGIVRTKNIELSDISLSTSQNTRSLEAERRDGIEYIEGSYGSVTLSDVNRTDLNMDLQIRLNYQSDESLVRPKSVQNFRHEYGIDAIEFSCTMTISQCRGRIETVDGERREGECLNIYPPEVEELPPLRVTLDSLDIQAPQKFLTAGISSADKIIRFTDALEPKVRKLYTFLRGGCLYSIATVLSGKIIGTVVPGVNDFVEFLWQGPEKFRNKGLYKDSFIISGRSFCSAVACPRDWCKALYWHPGDGRSLYQITGGRDGKPIQDSLYLSTVCGCVSGVLAKLYQIEATALKWRECLLTMQTTGEKINDCDRYLSEGICRFVIDEIQAVDNFNFGLFSRLTGGINAPNPKTPAEEAAEAGGILRNNVIVRGINEGTRSARHFARDQIAVLGAADTKNVLGYQNNLIASTFCSYAIYRDLPDFSTLTSTELKNPFLQSSTSSNYKYNVVYFDENNRPVYGYDISWMVVAGREGVRYDIYLETDQGARRPVYTGTLEKVGDFASDFIQITDNIEYTNICFDLKQESRRLRCYPPGAGSTGGLTDDIKLFTENVADSDKDKLPDDWETKYNCIRERTDFTNDQDKKACSDLLAKGKSNPLDPSKPNTDGRNKLDGSEDPDGDGYNNYQEYLENTHPNIPLGRVDGTSVQNNCYAKFDNLRVSGGDAITTSAINNKFVPGDKVSISLDNVRLLSGTAGVRSEDVVAYVEITGPRLFRNSQRIQFDQISSGTNFIVWDIPSGSDAPVSGIYHVRVQLISIKSGDEECRDEEGVLSEELKDILVYNLNKGSCVDSDGSDDFNVGGICADVTGINSDTCNTGTEIVSDFFCLDENSICQSLTLNCALQGKICRDGACISQ